MNLYTFASILPSHKRHCGKRLLTDTRHTSLSLLSDSSSCSSPLLWLLLSCCSLPLSWRREKTQTYREKKPERRRIHRRRRREGRRYRRSEKQKRERRWSCFLFVLTNSASAPTGMISSVPEAAMHLNGMETTPNIRRSWIAWILDLDLFVLLHLHQFKLIEIMTLSGKHKKIRKDQEKKKRRKKEEMLAIWKKRKKREKLDFFMLAVGIQPWRQTWQRTGASKYSPVDTFIKNRFLFESDCIDSHERI